jgi:hypothetical protein
MAELSSRGFEQYGEIETTYGHTVRVYESSAASGPHLWLKTKLVAERSTHALPPEEATAHLDLLQAITVRALLDEFIEGVPERWANGTSLLLKADKAWREANPELVLEQTRRNCQCCASGNHDFRCTCDGEGCCHPGHHAPAQDVPDQPEPEAPEIQALKPPVGSYVATVFRVDGYDPDCGETPETASMARLSAVDVDGEIMGWTQNCIGLYNTTDKVIDHPGDVLG